MSDDIIKREVKDYYEEKLVQYGPVPAGVDWNSQSSQSLRYKELLKCIDSKENFTVLDYGCGYGALLDLLNKEFINVHYTGFDLSEKMIEAAKSKYGENDQIHWLSKLESGKYDHVVASGLFNVRLEAHEESWLEYIKNTLIEFNKYANRSFAFNILTSYSDRDKMKDYLYYANPEDLFKFCKENVSRNVALYHDYGLYEFTIVVRKEIKV
jgi:cyclopropane fatty-acyl-phospholipid synthase-like methyltransferase